MPTSLRGRMELVAAFLVLLAPMAAQGVSLSISPTNMAWDAATWVDVSITGIPTNGTVALSLYVDVDRDGSVGTNDVALAQFDLQDGKTNDLGSIVMPADTNAADGVISTRISYHGLANDGCVYHGVGAYLWQARLADGSSDARILNITQAVSAAWISGQVKEYSTSNAVGGALVLMETFSSLQGPAPGVWTDTNGTFLLYVPPNITTGNVSAAYALTLNGMSSPADETGTHWISACLFTNDLTPGNNALSVPLYVINSPISGLVYEVAGRICDDATNAVGRGLVSFDSDDDTDITSLSITDTNGCYRLLIPAMEGIVIEAGCAGNLMNMRGLVSTSSASLNLSSNLSGMDLICPRASLLVRSTAADPVIGTPFAGVHVICEGHSLAGGCSTLPDGTYEIGMVAGSNYSVYIDNGSESLAPFGYASVSDFNEVNLPASGIYTNAAFPVAPGGRVSGHVLDAASNRITSAWGYVEARDSANPPWWINDASVDRQGYYEMLLPTGVYRIATSDYTDFGYLDLAYTNSYTWDNWKHDPVTVTTSGVSGLDFFLPEAAYIQGTVYGDSLPLEGIQVNAGAISGEGEDRSWTHVSGQETDSNGWYSLPVPAGTNYGIDVDLPQREGLFWLRAYYTNATSLEDATLVSAAVGAPTTNINLNLQKGGIISGVIYGDDGTSTVGNAEVSVETLEGDGMGNWTTSADGSYEAVVPAGLYRVFAYQEAWPGLYYSNGFAYQPEVADSVTATVGQVTSNINITFPPPSYIRGRATDAGSGAPVTGASVYAVISLDPENFGDRFHFTQTLTDSNGYYSITVPPGSNFMVHIRMTEPFYYAQVWSNAVDREACTFVDVGYDSIVSNINFDLVSGGKISGTVYEDDGMTPVPDCVVWAYEYGTGGWVDPVFTDESGYYSIIVAGGEYKVQATPSFGDYPFVDEWYNGVFAENAATSITVTVSNDTGGINFVLNPGGTISGHVYGPDGSTPVAGCYLETKDVATGEWFGEAWTESDGSYSLRVPPGEFKVWAQPRDPDSGGLPYANEWYDDEPAEADAMPVAAIDSVDTPDIDFVLEGGSIRGRVYYPDGTTGMGYCWIYVDDAVSGERRDEVQTAPDGSYELVVGPGVYTVRAAPSWNGQPFLDYYYGDVFEFAGSTAVLVADTNGVDDIDITMEPGHTISGTVYAEDGVTPVAHCFIRSEKAENWVENVTDTETDHAGTYTLRVPAGTYHVDAQPSENGLPYARQWYSGARVYSDAIDVDATSADVTNINFVLEVGGVVSGRLFTVQGGLTNPLAGARVYAVLRDANSNTVFVADDQTDGSGRYSFRLAASPHLVRSAAFSDYGIEWADKWHENTYDSYAGEWVGVVASGATANVDIGLDVPIIHAGGITNAVTNGLAWLASQQNPDGSWGTRFKISKTALAVVSFETYATASGLTPLDPAYRFYAQITNGLAYLLRNAVLIPIDAQPAGNPDTDGDGYGIYYNQPGPANHSCVDSYQTSMALMAIAASRAPTRVVTDVSSPLYGRKYRDVAQDIVDYFAWGQTDTGSGRGGWIYSATDNGGPNSDESNSGWVTLGLAYADECIGAVIPGMLLSELNVWVAAIQNQNVADYFGYGSAVYNPGDTTTSGYSMLRQGNLLQQFNLLGDTTSTPRVVSTLLNMERNWGRSWNMRPMDYHSAYATMKGLESFGVARLGDIKWFGTLTNSILNQQTAEGWWQDWSQDDGERFLATEWAIMTLQAAVVFNKAPVINLALDKTEGYSPLRVTFDFSASYDPDGEILRSEVDKESDAIYETRVKGAGRVIVEFQEPGTFNVLARVLDDDGASAVTSVTVSVWGSAPTAVIATTGTSATVAVPVEFIATNSAAVTNRTLVAYLWDFNGDGQADRVSTNAQVSWTYPQPGTNLVMVTVVDSEGVQDQDTVTVTVAAASTNHPTVSLAAAPSYGYIPMTAVLQAQGADSTGGAAMVEYRWDFDGDGQLDRVTTTNEVTHVYGAVGTFKAGVTVVDYSGAAASASKELRVRQASRLKVWISVPQDGAHVWGNEVSLHANSAPGSITASVQLQYKPATDTNWINLGAPMIPPESSFKTYWDVTGLLDGSNYDVRAVGTDTETNTVESDAVTVTVDSAYGKQVGGVVEQEVDGKHTKEETISKDQTASVDVSDGTTVVVPAGTVASNTTVVVELTGASSNAPNGAADCKENINADRKVTLEGAAQVDQPVTVDIPYPDADDDGVVDGTTVHEDTLAGYWYDVASGEWKRPLSSEVHKSQKIVRIKTYHLTSFGLFGSKNLLSPKNGGLLQFATSQYTNSTMAVNLADDNPLSYWRSLANPVTTQEFVYAFSGNKGIVATEAVLHNFGEAAAGQSRYSQSFSIRTSLDGTNYTNVVTDTLQAHTQPQTFGMGSVTCRYVRLCITSGADTQAWELAEFAVHGTFAVDVDGDLMNDTWETQYFGTLERDGNGDFDNDGLIDKLEAAAGSLPTVADTDGDGFSDRAEWIAGTGIGSSTSFFTIAACAIPTNNAPFTLEWDSLTGRLYSVYSKTNLMDASWFTNLYRAPGSGARKAFTNDDNPGKKYFRVIVELDE